MFETELPRDLKMQKTHNARAKFLLSHPKVYRQSRQEAMEGKIANHSHRKAKKYRQVMAHLRQ